ILCPWITISRTSPRSTAAIKSLKIISGSRRYCLLKTLKIINKTSAKTNQSAICFEDAFKQLLRAAATDSSSCGYRRATGRDFFCLQAILVASLQGIPDHCHYALDDTS